MKADVSRVTIPGSEIWWTGSPMRQTQTWPTIPTFRGVPSMVRLLYSKEDSYNGRLVTLLALDHSCITKWLMTSYGIWHSRETIQSATPEDNGNVTMGLYHSSILTHQAPTTKSYDTESPLRWWSRWLILVSWASPRGQYGVFMQMWTTHKSDMLEIVRDLNAICH